MTALGWIVIPAALLVVALVLVGLLHALADALGVPYMAVSLVLWIAALAVLLGGRRHD